MIIELVPSIADPEGLVAAVEIKQYMNKGALTADVKLADLESAKIISLLHQIAEIAYAHLHRQGE